MLLARFLLAGSIALMLGWAVLVGVVFEDPSLLRSDDRGEGAVSLELAAAIEELELLRDAAAELRGTPPSAPGAVAAETPSAPGAVAAETPSEPSPPVAAGAPPTRRQRTRSLRRRPRSPPQSSVSTRSSSRSSRIAWPAARA